MFFYMWCFEYVIKYTCSVLFLWIQLGTSNSIGIFLHLLFVLLESIFNYFHQPDLFCFAYFESSRPSVSRHGNVIVNSCDIFKACQNFNILSETVISSTEFCGKSCDWETQPIPRYTTLLLQPIIWHNFLHHIRHLNHGTEKWCHVIKTSGLFPCLCCTDD